MPTRAALRRAPRDLDELPLVLRPEDVAELLRCDLSTVYRMTRQGALPHRRLGRVLRYDRDVVAAWLAGNAEPDGEEPAAV